MKKRLLLLSLLVVSISSFAMKNETPVEKLNETVITTGGFGLPIQKVAKNIVVITQKEIKDKGAKSIDEALRGTPGVIIKKMDGAQSFSIDLRGSGDTASSNMIVLIDGVPYNGLATFDINSIPVEKVAKIEIIQGSGAVIYGNGAIGGVVNIITKSPIINKKYYGSIGMEYGSWKTGKLNANIGTKVTDKLSLETSYSGETTMEYRDRNEEYKGKKDKRQSIWLNAKYELEAGNVDLKYNHSNGRDYYTSYLSKEDFKKNPKKASPFGHGNYKTKNDLWNLSFNKKLNDKVEVFLQGGHNTKKYEYTSVSSYGPWVTKEKIKEYFVKPQVKYNYMDTSYLILGGDIRKGTNTDEKTSTTPKTIRKAKAIYVSNTNRVGDFEITEGYRSEKVKIEKGMTKKKFSGDSIELGVNYLYSDTGNTYFNYTRSFRAPVLMEVNFWKGDMNLHKTDTYELGLRDVYKNTSINTSVFYTLSKNEIYYDKLTPNPASWSGYGANMNFEGKVRRMGVQLSLEHDFDTLTLREKFSYINSKIKDGEHRGNKFAGVPEWTLDLGATYKFTDKFKVNVDGYYQSKTYAGDDFSNKNGKHNDYIVVGANASYDFDNGLELYGGVKNIFDKTYANAFYIKGTEIAPYPADGRSFYTGFKYTF